MISEKVADPQLESWRYTSIFILQNTDLDDQTSTLYDQRLAGGDIAQQSASQYELSQQALSKPVQIKFARNFKSILQIKTLHWKYDHRLV